MPRTRLAQAAQAEGIRRALREESFKKYPVRPVNGPRSWNIPTSADLIAWAIAERRRRELEEGR
jgi:hypothetical protein